MYAAASNLKGHASFVEPVLTPVSLYCIFMCENGCDYVTINISTFKRVPVRMSEIRARVVCFATLKTDQKKTHTRLAPRTHYFFQLIDHNYSQ